MLTLNTNEQVLELEIVSPVIQPEEIEVKQNNIELRPELWSICLCESGLKQFNDDGSILKGKVNQFDIGYCQINEMYWGNKAIELGFDIYTLDGNIAMSNWIYENYGTKYWTCSTLD
jgi:hypothetical protein